MYILNVKSCQPQFIYKDTSVFLFNACTANEGPVKIQCICLVPISVFPEMKLCSLVIIVSQFVHLYIFERFLYFQDRSVTKLHPNMWTYPGHIKIVHRHMNVGIGTEAMPFPGIHKFDFWYSVAPITGSIEI
jgi:hypothetical protein